MLGASIDTALRSSSFIRRIYSLSDVAAAFASAKWRAALVGRLSGLRYNYSRRRGRPMSYSDSYGDDLPYRLKSLSYRGFYNYFNLLERAA